MIWRFRGREMTFEQVKLMGILNVTPDSFSDGGKFVSKEKAVQWALELEMEGADLIDVGGESTKPGAYPVSLQEELKRVIPVIQEIRSRTPLPISIDTTKPEVAREALEAGADIVNDVDGLGAFPEMTDVVKEFGAGLILMHRRGTPQTMQGFAHYEHVVEEVSGELGKSFKQACQSGIDPNQIVLDPGVGFSKTAEQNLELIARLNEFHSWGRPILIGPSRKSFIGSLTGKSPEERDGGTAAAVTLSVMNGAHLIRVHQVSMMKDAAKVAQAIMDKKGQQYVRS